MLNIKEKSLWNNLRAETRPIILYGTGNGADKIIKVCEEKGIEIKGVFASGGFVRDRFFHDFKVLSFEDCEATYGKDFIVLLAFGTTLFDVMENINNIAKTHELYIPEVPLFGTDLFDLDYVNKNIDQIVEVYENLSDNYSKELYNDLINFRISGKYEYLKRTENPEETYRTIFDKCEITSVLDCGAYRGDSARDIINALSPEKVIAIEPDRRTFSKLETYAKGETRSQVIPVHAAIGNRNGTAVMKSTAGRSSGLSSITQGAKVEDVEIITIDELSKKFGKFDLIKYDVEGDEWDAINGGIGVIINDKPCLSISIYHRSEDIFKIPNYIKSIMPTAEIYIRRASCIPDWDILLLVKTDRFFGINH